MNEEKVWNNDNFTAKQNHFRQNDLEFFRKQVNFTEFSDKMHGGITHNVENYYKMRSKSKTSVKSTL